jgi:transcriptional regulator GlxA family with amidase domain
MSVIAPSGRSAKDGAVTERVTILTYDGVQSLDVSGPAEVFTGVNRLLGQKMYDLSIVASTPSVRTEGGLRICADPLPAPVTAGTVLVPGGFAAVDGSNTQLKAITDWLRASAPSRVATVCTGAFPAARAGLLDGHRVTTHWSEADRLAAEHPAVRVAGRELYIRDRDVWSSGGVTAGIDMTLALVGADHDMSAAQTLARWLVMYLHRPGRQSQYAGPVWHPPTSDARIMKLRRTLDADPGSDHRVEELADHVGLSTRHLQRLFTRETGVSLGAYLTELRMHTATSALAGSGATVATIARTSGFGSAESMRRTFVNQLGISPQDYRRRFTTHETEATS